MAPCRQDDFVATNWWLPIARFFAERRDAERPRAEGVENDAIADMLASIGGLSLQGYLYAKPMQATELAGWASEYQQRTEPAHPHTIHGWFAKSMQITRIVRSSLLHMPNLLNDFTINDGIHKELQENPCGRNSG